MKATIEIDGLKEATDALAKVDTELPSQIKTAMYEATFPIADATASYPERPETEYVRTGRYGRSVGTIIETDGYDIVGIVGASMWDQVPYSIYLRGTEDGSYRGAWMHTFWWESLYSIAQRLVPSAIEKLRDRINEFIANIFTP